MQIYTSSWFTPLPPDIIKIGISRGVPRGYPAGYRRIKSLEPGSWFNSVTPEKYHRLFMEQLGKLDAATIMREIEQMAVSTDKAALLCYEPPGDSSWCHRGQVAAWLRDECDIDVYEFGEEGCGCGWRHPKIYRAFRAR